MMKYFNSDTMRFNKSAVGFNEFVQNLSYIDVNKVEYAIRSFHMHLNQNDVDVQRVRAILHKKAPSVCKKYARLRVQYLDDEYEYAEYEKELFHTGESTETLARMKFEKIEEEHFTKLFALIVTKLENEYNADLSKLKDCINLIRNGIFVKATPLNVFLDNLDIDGRFNQIANDLIEQGYWRLKDLQTIFDNEVEQFDGVKWINQLKRFVRRQNNKRSPDKYIDFTIGPYGRKLRGYNSDNVQLIEIIKSYTHKGFIMEDLRYLVTLSINLDAMKFLVHRIGKQAILSTYLKARNKNAIDWEVLAFLLSD